MTSVSSRVQGSLAPAEAPRHALAGAAHEALVWPAWGIALLGALCVLIGLTYFALRLRRSRTRRDDL
jgi:hypothetical protein